MRRSLAAGVLVVLVIVLAAGVASARKYDHYLSGYWVGSPAFLESAGLKDFQLFVAPPGRGGGREGYLIVTDHAGGFLANTPVELRLSSPVTRWWSALRSTWRARDDAYEASVAVGSEGEIPLPARMRLSLSLMNGTLTMSGDGQVYAQLEKDASVSASAVQAYRD